MTDTRIIISDEFRYSYGGIWYAISECNYTDCQETVYGDEDSIIVNRVFCSYHYTIVLRFISANS